MKTYSSYICQQCSYQSPSYLGKCPQCGEWNSLVESIAELTRDDQLISRNFKFEENLVRLSQVKSQDFKRTSTGFAEFDRVLGGGIVQGSIILISGEPGIGKSTLLLQCAMRIASFAQGRGARRGDAEQSRSVNGQLSNVVLYVSGEESAQQIKIRATRIGKSPENLYVLPEVNVETIVAASEKIKPGLVIIDSIQTLTSSRLSGSAGSVGQVRESAQILQAHAKKTHTPIFIVGHVTKEGNIAGPKVLEHLVDGVLNMEGDALYAFRVLRSLKNRFGSTFEVGIFEMTDAGMLEVENPSKIFLAQRIASRAGSVVASTITGDRPILAEIQALTTSTIFGVPTRRVTGLDFSRVQIVIASLTKVANLPLGNLDIYVNVAGGLKINEPACDLAVALAIASAATNRPIRQKICAFGEVGLLGELRLVSLAKNRMTEAKRLGFVDFVTSERFKTLEAAIDYSLEAKSVGSRKL